ncbi:hypothetical protein [Sphingobium chungbukense]|uniref:Uncharacterized protein n=1 Tax=Sphingobium chungbukense TaxID=56193 RepID=A0A0M3AK45_9SPHN|nr:hypothetical protein [Sphingobium chungbukense]KKW90467.1 hypothetical protein YP76_20150 [Sphingobium chungbukense]
MTKMKSYAARIVEPHEPRYWTAQATGFRLIRLLDKYLILTHMCGRSITVARTSDERKFFTQEFHRVNGIAKRIARQIGHSNGYTILRARAVDSPAYRVVVEHEVIALAAEFCIEKTPQFLALQQFRADVERLANEEMRATAGASYELYARQFSAGCARTIDDLDPQLQPYAVAIALYHGYIEDEDERYADFGPGYCSLSGIDEEYCHCGRHP